MGIGAFIFTYLAAPDIWFGFSMPLGKMMNLANFAAAQSAHGYFWQYVWTHFLIDLPWIFGGALILAGIVLVLGIVSKGRMVDVRTLYWPYSGH